MSHELATVMEGSQVILDDTPHNKWKLEVKTTFLVWPTKNVL